MLFAHLYNTSNSRGVFFLFYFFFYVYSPDSDVSEEIMKIFEKSSKPQKLNATKNKLKVTESSRKKVFKKK